MKKILLLLLSLLLITGCVPVLIGVGVVTGYTLSNDSASGNIKSEYRILWDICMDRLQEMESEIYVANESKGIIKAKLSDNSVVVKINTISSNIQRLRVSSRRFLLPRPHFAQKVFFEIVEGL